MFAYYAKCFFNFSEKVRPLNSATTFPLTAGVNPSNILKQDLVEASLKVIDENVPFTVETDAPDTTLSATLNQEGRSAAFFSRTLQGSEMNETSVEKEAQGIVGGVNKWGHFLLGKHFTLITDQ